MKAIFFVLGMCVLICKPVCAQFFDSLHVNIGSSGTFGQKEYQPHWLISNQFGAVSNQQVDASTYLGISNTHYFGKKKLRPDSGNLSLPVGGYVAYGITAFNNNHFQDFTIQEGYLKVGFKKFEARFGRIKEIPGEVDKDLSSGSLGISGNALPIPKVGIALTEYASVPFTNGWLQIKGQLSHGWFGNNRYMKDAFYHEKALYLRAGKKKFKFFVGMQHYAEWAGRRGDVQLERSWKGFWDVFFAKTANDGSVDPAANPNRAGDQRGLLEIGFDLESKNYLVHFYNQSPFESGYGINIKNIDRLAGLSIVPKSTKSVLKKILFEFIYTRQMEEYAPTGSRQTYYNNGYYRTGWDYENQVVGSPLFINRTIGQNYFEGIKPFGWDTDTTKGNVNIIFMRMTGGNIGGIYSLGKKLTAKTLVTYVVGLYKNQNQGQLYCLQQLDYQLNKQLLLKAGIAVDAGDLSKNIGLAVGVHWKFAKL